MNAARWGRRIGALLIFCFVVIISADAQFAVLTQRNDNLRSGVYTNETVLSPANVNTPNFGKLFSLAVDGRVFAQPLYVPNVSVGGVSHNVVYIATEHNSVYAYDADGLVTNSLWQANLTALGCPTRNTCTSVPASVDSATSDLVPEVGITGTPVIDAATGTLYAVAKTQEVVSNTTNYVYRLHALDITTGSERAGSPVVIQGQVPGTGIPNNKGKLVFSPLYSLQRPGLALVNNGVYIAFGSWGDDDMWHGWIFGYDKTSLLQTGVMSTTPNGTEGHGGIWMHGTGLAVDANGYIYVSTGNGAFDGLTNFGDSVLKLATPALTVADYFTPYNQQVFDSGDEDLAAGGNVLLPDGSGTAQYPHIMIGCAKNGAVYVLDRDNLGQFNSSGDTQIIQELLNVIGGTVGDPNSTGMENCYTTPTYWQGHVYFGGSNDAVKMFNISGGLLTASAVSQSSTVYQFPGTTVSVSSNGSTNGIVWAIENAGSAAIDESGTAAVLHAYDANNLASELYNSSQISTDNAGAPVKFAVPTIANGKVYVGTQNSVAVYGIFSNPVTPAPQMSPADGIYTASVTVTITDSLPGAAIYYTTDGSVPTSSSAQYSAPITISSTTTLKAMAIAPGYTTSATASAVYTIEASAPTIGYGTGFTGVGMTLNGSATYSGSHLRLTDGGTNEAASAFYSTAVNIQSFTTDFWILLTNPSADGIAFVIQNAGLTAIGSNGGGLGYGPNPGISTAFIGSSMAVKFDLYDNAGEGTNSTGLYTNGTSPTTPATTIANVDLHSGDMLAVHVTYDGTTLAMTLTDTVTGATFNNNWTINIPTTVGGNTAYVGFTGGTGGLTATQDVVYWAFASGNVQPQAAMPTFSPVEGIYTSAQSVTISDSTAGATIYYTTDGSTPTTASTVFNPNTPIQVSTTTTIKAIAAASGYSNSTVASGTYAIGNTAVNYSSGFTAAGLTFNGAAVISGTRLRLTDGGGNEAASAYFSTPVNVQAFTTNFSLQMTNATADGMTFVIQGSGSGALGPPGGGLGYGPDSTIGTPGIPTSVAIKFDIYNNAGEGSDSTGMYTNGASPTTPAVDMTAGGVNPANGDVYNVQITYDGTTLAMGITDTRTNAQFSTNWAVNIPGIVGGNTAYVGFTGGTGGLTAIQDILTWTYSTSPAAQQAATPTFSPAAGTYTSAQNVTISDTTTGATIYYTTDGSTPTTASTVFNPATPIQVSTTTTIKAIAAATGYNNSNVGSAAYAIVSSGCAQNLAIGSHTLCGEAYNDVSAASVTVNYAPSAGNGIIAWATWCFESTCSTSTSGITATIGDNINATESCFAASPHSPFITNANGGAQGSGDFQQHYVWYCPSIPSGVTSFTVTPSNPNLSYLQLNISEWKAGSLAASCSPISACFENVDNFGQAGNSTGGTTATITTSGSTVNANDLVFAVTEVPCCSFTASPGTGYTGITVAPSVTPGMVSEAKAVTATGIQTATTTWTGGSTPWFGVIVPLKGAGAALVVATPTFSPGTGTYSSAQTVTISSTTTGATICYTTNGTTPAATTPGTCSTGNSLANGGMVTVSASETLEAIGTESGFSNSSVGSALYTIQLPTAATPTFSPVAGTYTSAQSVTISDTTTGATIYYTTDGSTPTTASAVFNPATPIQVSTTTTIKAIAAATGYNTSSVGSALYTIQLPTAATPSISPASGTYSSPLSVTISDSTPGAKIYYTTNGTTPTTSSTVYSGPITLMKNTNIKVIAAAAGYSNSSVASASYKVR